MKYKYLTPTYLYDEAEQRLTELIEKKQQAEKRLLKYQPGRIHIVSDHGRIKYYLRTNSKDKSGIYIHKNETKKIKTYLQKKYDEDIVRLISSEIAGIERFLHSTKSSVGRIRTVFSNRPSEIKQYLTPIDMSDEDYIANWLATSYEKKDITGVPDDYTTEKGEIVRSKSELNIANYLYKMNIPYRYECKLTFSDGYHIYPDFTILDVKRRREVYWEHRGMMDDEGYACDSVKRIKRYNKNGLFLVDSLIITEETSNHHLGTWEIQSVINHYFIKLFV